VIEKIAIVAQLVRRMTTYYVYQEPARHKGGCGIELLHEKGGGDQAGTARHHELDFFGLQPERNGELHGIRSGKPDRHQHGFYAAFLGLPAHFKLPVYIEHPGHIDCGLGSPKLVTRLREAPVKP
jgi:hypothetical protein